MKNLIPMSRRPFKALLSGLFVAGLVACADTAEAPAQASQSDTSETLVLINADIVTVNAAQPDAEALAVRDGKILAVGDRAAVEAAAGSGASVRDMGGQTILPGLIDGHGHFMLSTFFSTMADLQPPPAGGVRDIAELVARLETWSAANPDAPWILGFGYDDSLLAEERHPTREDLDRISADKPIMLFHVSGHLMSCNSACLAVAGIDADTADPAGGIIRRRAGTSEPDGVLEELAMQPVFGVMPLPSPQQLGAAMARVQNNYAASGLTTVQEGAGRADQLQGLAAFASSGALKLDVVGYQLVRGVEDFETGFEPSETYQGHYRLGGIKLVLDGSPQGKTAWLTQPYHTVPEGLPDDYKGYAAMESSTVNAILDSAFSKNIQVLAHANGDAAGDQLLAGIEAAHAANGAGDRRPVMIHAQTARDDQIAIMKAEGVIPSYFVAHTFFWGDWHRESVFGAERARRISPLASSISQELTFTIHNDAPVVPSDMMRLIWAAVNRQTRSGQTLGPDERVAPIDAIKAVTIDAAYQYFEEDLKGSIEVGKLADLTVLSANPLSVPPETIKDIRVLETIKEGETVFAANP